MWSCSYAAMKLILHEIPLGLALVLRVGISALTLLLIVQGKGLRFSIRDLILILGVGILNFAVSPYLQFRSLQLTSAAEVAVMVAFEPLVTALLATIILREQFTLKMGITFLIATIGVLIMSGIDVSDGFINGSIHLLGNALFFGAILCEGIFSITSRAITQRRDPLRMVTLMMLAGAVTDIIIYRHDFTMANLSLLSSKGWGAVLFLSLGCSVFAYVGWSFLTRKIPVSRMVLSLFMQPILGGLAGYILLGEVPSPRVILGAVIILSTLIIWTKHIFSLRASKTNTTSPCTTPTTVIAANS